MQSPARTPAAPVRSATSAPREARPLSGPARRCGSPHALDAPLPSYTQWFGLFPRSEKSLGLRARRRRVFAVKMHQVRQNRLRTELPQQRGHLASMIAAVVHEMLHRLPKRIAVDAEFQRLVLHHAVQVRLRQSAHKTKQARLKFVPALQQTRYVLELCRIRKRCRRTALKAFQPDPLGAENVPQGVADRANARTHRLHKLFSREAGSCVKRSMIGPGVVVIQHSHLLWRHLPSTCKIRLRLSFRAKARNLLFDSCFVARFLPIAVTIDRRLFLLHRHLRRMIRLSI